MELTDKEIKCLLAMVTKAEIKELVEKYHLITLGKMKASEYWELLDTKVPRHETALLLQYVKKIYRGNIK